MRTKKTMEFIDTATNQVRVLTPDKFALHLEQRVHEGLSYLEAIIEFCEQYDADHIIVKKLLTPNITTSLKEEAIQLNLIRGQLKKKTKSLL